MSYDFSRFWTVLSVMLAGGVMGLVSALLAVETVSEAESVQNGPWQTSARYGSAEASPWMRTAVSLAGLFALRREEAVYYTATRDSNGERLRSDCVYWLTGRPPPARWWSVTAYGPDHFLIPNPENVWSASFASTAQDSQGRVQIQLGGSDQGGAWIPTGPVGAKLSVTLRLYNPEADVYDNLGLVPLFAIDRGDCQ